jgi:hypothetical protein
MIGKIFRAGLTLAAAATVAACATTCDLPEVSETATSDAARMFQEERQGGTSRARPGAERAARNVVEVAERVEPVAERFCDTETAEIEGVDCDVRVVIDERMPYRNA